ncbi:MAG TPA: glycosyltransferase [Actinomycetota bacterium]|nr:glycosyltransferase [Actinomycetota bacterium]
MAPLRILTWHIHGNYLWYLSRIPHELYLPVRSDGGEGYGGRGTTFPFGPNVHDVPADEVGRLDLDVMLYQSRRAWEEDRFALLSPAQRRLPAIYLEHDPPREHPTDTRHPVDDPDVLLVHVTPFNELMWSSGRTPTRVIEHGVAVPPGVDYTGQLARGIAVVNNLPRRGRRVGADLFERARHEVPLDLVGMGSTDAGGLGEVPPPELPAFVAPYRFFFHPIRYTSLGLALCEAMMIGMPVVAPSTTEVASVVRSGESGIADTDVGTLIDGMWSLLEDPPLARSLGEGARRVARERFDIRRFVGDWDRALAEVAGRRRARVAAAAATLTP